MTCTCKLCMAVPPEQRPVHKTEADLAPWLDDNALAAANDQMRRDNYGGIPVKHWPERIVRAYLTALRAERAPEGWRPIVKPLEWQGPFKPGENGSHYDHIFADSVLGRYTFEWKSWKEDDPGITTVECPGDFFYSANNLDEAKAAAQADYEARIRSALDVAPEPPALRARPPEGEKPSAPITSKELIERTGGSDKPFEVGPFPPEERMIPARDGIEAQHGLNDIYPGDPYPAARPPEGEQALETVNAVREAFTTQTNSAAPDFDSGYLTALDEVEQALRKAKPSQHAHIADALEYLARREAELKARPPTEKVEELIKRLRASADPSWEQQISHIETKAARGVSSNEGVSEWDIKGWMLVLRGLLSDNIEAADTLERLSRRVAELEAEWARAAVENVHLIAAEQKAGARAVVAEARLAAALEERDHYLNLYRDWKALAECHHTDGQKHWERATTAEARAAELEAELAKFEPDLLPDDPKVARLTVRNSVWEWMRVGYRLHHAGRVGEQLAAVKTKLDTALEVLERRLPEKTPAEIQSGLDRLQNAEGLIEQLPSNHDGRNTWLMNYGRGEEAQAKRAARGLVFDTKTAAARKDQP